MNLGDILDIVVPVVMCSSLVQFTTLGSGSHSPFPIHVDELGPLSIASIGQMNVMFAPTNAGSS